MSFQIILFEKLIWNKKESIKWLKDRNLKSNDMDDKQNNLSFKQSSIDEFTKFKTIEAKNQKGIKFVYGYK